MSFIEPDLERDEITVTYDRKRVTTTRLLKLVVEQGFKCAIVPTRPSSPLKNSRIRGQTRRSRA